jgi:threonine/homoserine/homoserine lactone efflux protein
MTLSLDLLLGFALFALVTSITPGPNNTMLLASGVNFGFICRAYSAHGTAAQCWIHSA